MDESQKKQAMIIALRALTASPKSRMDLTQKLKEKGFPADVIQETLLGLEKSGFLNDKSYAQNLAFKFTQAKPSGVKKLKFELKRHGISESVREEILAGISEEDQAASAWELAQARWHRLQSTEPEKRKKRVFDFLMRRGFDYQTVREVIEKLKAENDNAENG